MYSVLVDVSPPYIWIWLKKQNPMIVSLLDAWTVAWFVHYSWSENPRNIISCACYWCVVLFMVWADSARLSLLVNTLSSIKMLCVEIAGGEPQNFALLPYTITFVWTNSFSCFLAWGQLIFTPSAKQIKHAKEQGSLSSVTVGRATARHYNGRPTARLQCHVSRCAFAFRAMIFAAIFLVFSFLFFFPFQSLWLIKCIGCLVHLNILEY